MLNYQRFRGENYYQVAVFLTLRPIQFANHAVGLSEPSPSIAVDSYIPAQFYMLSTPLKYLVGGLEHSYFSIYWEESSQLTFIFFRGVETINQIWLHPGVCQWGFSQQIPVLLVAFLIPRHISIQFHVSNGVPIYPIEYPNIKEIDSRHGFFTIGAKYASIYIYIYYILVYSIIFYIIILYYFFFYFTLLYIFYYTIFYCIILYFLIYLYLSVYLSIYLRLNLRWLIEKSSPNGGHSFY